MARLVFPERSRAWLAAACTGLLIQVGCATGTSTAPVTITVTKSNVVSHWNEVAANTINQPAVATGTPEEQRPIYATDLATVHLAMYDAVIAIEGTRQPYAVRPASPVAGASPEAAAGAAAYGVLKGLFPSRGAFYEAAWGNFVASLPDDAGRRLGLAVGAEAAAGLLAVRANDGRSVVLAPYVPSSTAGQFRGATPINRFMPFVKPFVVKSHAQFRAPPPPAVTSAAYAADLNETRALGSATSTTRTAEQTEIARFNTEPPPVFWTRNLRQFAMTGRSLADHVRLTAMLWAAHADATSSCFESKYHYNAWRPASAITLAETDGNDATTADPTWTPVVPTPNHPEYPAAHSCVASATAAVLREFYRTNDVRFEFDSTVTGTRRQFAAAHALVDELAVGRIAGGMHFRYAAAAGNQLGDQVGTWVATQAFARR
jgi:PAP2 superfamily